MKAELRAKLVHEANQVSLFFEFQTRRDAADAAAEHFTLFWAPSLRRLLISELEAGGAGLRPVARAAILKLAASRGDDDDEGSSEMNDPDLEARLKMAIDAAPALRYQAIHLKVEPGKVILEGSVDSEPDRELVERLVQANAGLRTVEDRLRIIRPEPSA